MSKLAGRSGSGFVISIAIQAESSTLHRGLHGCLPLELHLSRTIAHGPLRGFEGGVAIACSSCLVWKWIRTSGWLFGSRGLGSCLIRIAPTIGIRSMDAKNHHRRQRPLQAAQETVPTKERSIASNIFDAPRMCRCNGPPVVHMDTCSWRQGSMHSISTWQSHRRDGDAILLYP